MWKSIIIVTSLLLAFNSVEVYAADSMISKYDNQDNVISSEDKMSFSEFMNNLNEYSDVEAGLIFGQEEIHRYQKDPRNKKDGHGIGIGLSFTF